jgi:hypothetical protein
MSSSISLEIHGIDEDSLRGYLVSLGGTLLADRTIAGPGWLARITCQPDYRLGLAAFCSYRVEMEGEEQTLREVWPRFEVKILRPGG